MNWKIENFTVAWKYLVKTIFTVIYSSKYTVWKLRKFSLTEEIFREINSLVTYLVKPLVSRNFYYLRKRESNGNFQNFSLQYRSVVWKLRNFIATFPWNQLFAKELYSKLIWRKKIAWQKNSRFSTLWINHSVMVCVAIMDILSHTILAKISWNRRIY